MNNFHTGDLLELAKKRNQEEIFSLSIEKATQGSAINRNRWLAALGTWMVANGEKLQAPYTASLQTKQFEFSRGNAKKARA